MIRLPSGTHGRLLPARLFDDASAERLALPGAISAGHALFDADSCSSAITEDSDSSGRPIILDDPALESHFRKSTVVRLDS